MPKPSPFVRALRHRGIHVKPPATAYDRRSDGYWSVEHGIAGGARLAAISNGLRGATALTSRLCGKVLAKERSDTTTERWRGSDFVRMVVKFREGYREQPEERSLAIAHAEFVLTADVETEPLVPWLASDGRGRIVLMMRLLDVHVQNATADQQGVMLELLGTGLSKQLAAHLECVVAALIDLNDGPDGYGRPRLASDQLTLQMQGDTSDLTVAGVLVHCISAFGEAWDGRHIELCEYVDLDASPEVEITGKDAAFAHAIERCSLPRRPPTPRARLTAPNEIHHLLIKPDPVLRAKGDKVLNLSALASYQAKAREQTSPDDGERNEFVDWYERGDRSDYDLALERMQQNPDLDLVRWTFLVDDATRVFVVRPWREGELDADSLLTWMDSAWAGHHGLLRGRPASVSLPASYAGAATRDALTSQLKAREVLLSAPTSGFAAPLSVLKSWCERSASMERCPYNHGASLRQPNLPGVVSWKFVQDWAFSHTLSEHAESYFKKLAGNEDRLGSCLAYAGTGYAAMSTIEVAEYAAAVSVGDVPAFFERWKNQCDPKFRSSYEAR